MFYISSVKDKMIGVTDTDDGIEEWYTRDQVTQFLTEFNTLIRGAVHDSKGLSVTVTTPELIKVEEMPMGSAFELHKEHEVEYFVKMSNVGNDSFHVYDSRFNFTTLKRNIFLTDKDLKVCDCSDVVWFTNFKNWLKKNQPMTCERLYA